MQGKTINGFILQRLIGKGGMAEVWYAENEIGKPAAVKMLNEDLSHNTQIVERFRNEAVVMVKLNHSNIRQVYGYGIIDERPCIIMEYLEGSDLKARLKSGQRFTKEELEKWWNQLASALNYTHAQGVVHRDIKPSNIFIDNNGDVKLLDFGIAKVRESISMTQTGAMMGTLMYMSPEQVQDSKHLGPASDVYSLAVTFVHLLTGKAPYDSTTSNDYTIRKGIVELDLDLSALPSLWRGFLKPYLAKVPTDRPALRAFEMVPETVHDMASDEDDVTIADETPASMNPVAISETPESTGKPKSKKVWRIMIGVFVAVAVVSLVWSIIAYWNDGRISTLPGFVVVMVGVISAFVWMFIAIAVTGGIKPAQEGKSKGVVKRRLCYLAFGILAVVTTYVLLYAVTHPAIVYGAQFSTLCNMDSGFRSDCDHYNLMSIISVYVSLVVYVVLCFLNKKIHSK